MSRKPEKRAALGRKAVTLHRRKASRDKNYPCRGQTTRSSLFRTNVRSGNPDLMGDIRRVKRKTPGKESPLKNQKENSTQTQQYPPPCNSVPALSCAQVISRKRTAVGSVLSRSPALPNTWDTSTFEILVPLLCPEKPPGSSILWGEK